MKKPSDTFALRLRNLRQRAGLTVSDLAESAGMGRTYLHDLEAGRREPSLKTASRLAGALKASLAAFDGLA